MNSRSSGSDEVVFQMSREEANVMLSSLDDVLDKWDLFSWKDLEVVAEFKQAIEKEMKND